jgi:hypothetical protein
MNDRSTYREQFLAEIDQIRQLRRRYWLSMIALPFLGIVSLIAADFIHPIFILLLALPIVLARAYAIKLGLVKCPRCGQFYNGDPKKPFDRRRPRIGWGLLGTSSRCVYCDFAL